MEYGTSRIILFLNSSLASGKIKKKYLIAIFKQWLHVKNSFRNILLKTAWLCDVRLQNYGAINFVKFFGPPCIQ